MFGDDVSSNRGGIKALLKGEKLLYSDWEYYDKYVQFSERWRPDDTSLRLIGKLSVSTKRK